MNLRHTRIGIAACIGALALAAPAAAQSVRGRAIDAETGRAVAGVRVTLLRARSDSVTTAFSDTAGYFTLFAAGTGEHLLRADHIAYRQLTTELFRILSREQVVVDLKLTTAAVALEPLVITARRADPRHEPTVEGFYARQLRSRPIGTARVVTRIDPEMAGALDPRDVLSWVRIQSTRRRCMVLYWNGVLVNNAVLVDDMLQTPVAHLEGLEYYRSPSEAPAVFREIPSYLDDNVFCEVVALWSRTGHYRDPPPAARRPSRQRIAVAAALTDVAGEFSPGIGVALEASTYWPLARAVSLGAYLRGSTHQLAAETADALTRNLRNAPFVLPPGQRGIQLYVAGVEPRLTLRRTNQLRPVVTARVQVAQRRLSLESTSDQRDIGMGSWGFGIGATAGAELLLDPRKALTASLGYDWFTFGAYGRIEQHDNPTAAAWRALALRVGITYNLGR